MTSLIRKAYPVTLPAACHGLTEGLQRLARMCQPHLAEFCQQILEIGFESYVQSIRAALAGETDV